MFFKEWEILLVDDNPDVLTVSKLAMQNFEVYGLPLKIHTAASKAEALDLLKSRPKMQYGLAVAFIDVVMESDTAGLELCQTIRETMGNRLTQLFVRTGYPDIAPERTVIDQYDINGFFTKTEATEDKLYTLIKGGVRQFFWSMTSFGTISLLDNVTAVSGSRQKIIEQYQLVHSNTRAGSGRQKSEPNPAFMSIDGQIISVQGWSQETAKGLIQKLDQQIGKPIGRGGNDKFVMDKDNHLMIKVGTLPNRSELIWLTKSTFVPPIDIVELMHHAFSGIANVWFVSR